MGSASSGLTKACAPINVVSRLSGPSQKAPCAARQSLEPPSGLGDGVYRDRCGFQRGKAIAAPSPWCVMLHVALHGYPLFQLYTAYTCQRSFKFRFWDDVPQQDDVKWSEFALNFMATFDQAAQITSKPIGNLHHSMLVFSTWACLVLTWNQCQKLITHTKGPNPFWWEKNWNKNPADFQEKTKNKTNSQTGSFTQLRPDFSTHLVHFGSV